jgi:hypothetical protein
VPESLGLFLRWLQARPRLRVEADVGVTNLMLTARNSGPQDARIERLYLEVRRAKGLVGNKRVVGEVHLPGLPFIDASELPKRIASKESAYFYISMGFLELRLKALGYEGKQFLTPTVVDGLGNRFNARPFWFRVR